MSKEQLQGYTNRLLLNPDGTITKLFEDNGVTKRSSKVRQDMESFALKNIAFSPHLLKEVPHAITMTRLEGETGMDGFLPQLPEATQFSIFESAGRALRFVHQEYQTQNSVELYLNRLVNDCMCRVPLVENGLLRNDIDPNDLQNYLSRSVDINEIKRCGITVIHGDYWLNNIIGKINSKFCLTGIIDWEMGGTGSPYQDFALVALSMEQLHPVSREAFWRGYGLIPDEDMKQYFSIRQILIWMSEDLQADFSSEFYKDKLELIRKTL